MRIEKNQNVEPSPRVSTGGPSTKSQPHVSAADTTSSSTSSKRSGDVAEIVGELRQQNSMDRANRQALLQAVKQRLAEGEYLGRESSEKTAVAILSFLAMKFPR